MIGQLMRDEADISPAGFVELKERREVVDFLRYSKHGFNTTVTSYQKHVDHLGQFFMEREDCLFKIPTTTSTGLPT